jgi:hypothetical protein
MSSTASTLNVSTFFQMLFTGIKSGLVTDIVPALITFIQNTKGLNPLTNVLTYVAQLDLLRSSVIAGLPNLVQSEIAQIDAVFSNELQSVLAAAQASATPVQAHGIPA